MEERDDLLLQQFFSEAATQQIADDGFSERVMRRLPTRINWFVRLWNVFCVAVGVVLFVVFRGWELLADHFILLLRTLLNTQFHFSLMTTAVVIFGLLFVAVGEVVTSERRLL